MAKRTARRAAASSSAASGKVCPFCGEKGCNCMKRASGFKILIGLVVLGFAAGVLMLNTAAWVVGLLVLIQGLMMFKSHMG